LRRVAIALPVAPRDSAPTLDLLGSYSPAWLLRSGEGAGEVVGCLSKPPVLSDPSDHLTALTTWYGLLHQDIRKFLDEVGPQPGLATAPSVGDALHAAG
jgi:hypothetical protein